MTYTYNKIIQIVYYAFTVTPEEAAIPKMGFFAGAFKLTNVQIITAVINIEGFIFQELYAYFYSVYANYCAACLEYTSM